MKQAENIEWYDDKKTSVYFNKIPEVGIRYCCPTSTKRERQSIKKYPFINESELKVSLFDHIKRKAYHFSVPEGYCYDGASIPRMFWRLIGPPTSPAFLIPALIHDNLCEHHEYVEYDRAFSSRVFDCLLKVNGVCALKRGLMKQSVDLFQRGCGWKEPK